MAFDKVSYDNNYVKEHFKRISLNLKPDLYKQVELAAKQAGLSITAYITQAVEKELNK